MCILLGFRASLFQKHPRRVAERPVMINKHSIRAERSGKQVTSTPRRSSVCRVHTNARQLLPPASAGLPTNPQIDTHHSAALG